MVPEESDCPKVSYSYECLRVTTQIQLSISHLNLALDIFFQIA